MTHIYEALKTQQAAEARIELQNSVAVKHQTAALKLHTLCEQLVMGHNIIVAQTDLLHTQVLGYVSAAVTFRGPYRSIIAVSQSFSSPSYEELVEIAHDLTRDAARDLGSASLVELLTL